MRKIKTIFICFFVLWNLFSLAQVNDQIVKSIVRVHSGSKYSTGFFWKNGSTIVTSLHAISNSNNIEICLSGTTTWKPVSLKKVHKLSDLVLLNVSGYISPNFLTERYFTTPSFQTKCFTIGYNSGSPNYISREFYVGLSEKNTLKSILPNTLWNEVNSWGFLSLSTEVVYIEGQLLHGFSGAPVVDLQGKLIGVADGGLENGAAGISWCINSKYLASIENSNDDLEILNQTAINNLFASEEYENNENASEYVQLNEFKFKKIKTRTFAQLDMTGKYSSMDGLGLKQLLYNFSAYNYSSFRYDIYLEENSGATIVIPAGDVLETEDGQIVSGSEKIKLYLYLTNSTDIQNSSLLFEGNIMPNYNISWLADQVWSYQYPYQGPNGSYVRRRAYYGNLGRNYLFEALAAKDKYFLGAAAKRDNLFFMTTNDYEAWAKYAIAIQLTSFTN
jgi:hypothetical protein